MKTYSHKVLYTFDILHSKFSSGDVCGGYMLGDNGFIESPNYPEKYGNNKLCIWRIKVAPEKTLDFTLGTGPKLSRIENRQKASNKK